MLRRLGLAALALLVALAPAAAQDIPSHAIPIVRHVTAAGAIYTVPASRRLIVTSVWVGGAGSTTSGRVSVTADVRRDASRTLLDVPIPASAASGGNGSVDLPGIAVGPAGVVTLVTSGLTGGLLSGGFAGYEMGVLPGEGEI